MSNSEMNSIVVEVTESIKERSKKSRRRYLEMLNDAASNKPARSQISCTNLAHVFAASSQDEKLILKDTQQGFNIGIVTAYNDMLSAHQPYYRYPELLKAELYKNGMSAQVAGGVPAMCDGVTQGQTGMELSLFSRDTIALSTAVALSHQVFDGVMLLGICDKIVPGMLMGALRFGHLPVMFIPAGPMPSGISNADKAKVRQSYAEGKVDEKALLESEAAAYHAPGTCTFYGTANSNQMLLEAMGLMLPGSAFVPPNSDERKQFNIEACSKMRGLCEAGSSFSMGQLVTAEAIVNAIVVLLATGGSTNLSIHWIAVAKAAGWHLTWEDMNTLSQVVPLLTRVYPNGPEDINAFHQAGGTAWVFNELMSADLMYETTHAVNGKTQKTYARQQRLTENGFQELEPQNSNSEVLSNVESPFSKNGGLNLLQGNLGKAIVKVSAVKPEKQIVSATAKVFTDQQQVIDAFNSDQLNQDVVVVLTHQGPKANGMPELHKLMPILSSLQDKGFAVALLTDGRLSGASGKVLAAIHCVPEALDEGPISKIRDGDQILVDAQSGELSLLGVDEYEFDLRESKHVVINQTGVGRELFSVFRKNVTSADEGAISIDWFEE